MTKINIVVAAQTNSAIQGLNEVTQATKRTGDGVRKAQRNLKSFGDETNNATKFTRKFAMGGLQQAGYQIGDYAVQVANGTSKMQAFGQQAPQLLQIFGPIGAVVGAGVAIFAAFAVAIEKTTKASNNFKDAMKSLSESVASYESKSLMSQFGVDTEAEAKALQQISEIRRSISNKFAEMAETDNLRTRQRISEEIKAERLKLQPIQAQLDLLEERREAYNLTIRLNEQMMGQDRRNNKLIGDAIRAVQREQDARSEAHRSLMAGYHMAARVEKANAEKREHLARGEAQRTLAMSNEAVARTQRQLDKQMSAHAQYYQSRVAGEIMVARATESASKAIQVGRSRGMGGPTADEINKFNFEAQLAQAEEYRKYLESLSDSRVSGIKKEASAIKNELSPAMRQLQSIQDSVSTSFENGFMSIIDGTKSVKNAFKSMASEIIKELYRIFVVKKITGMISGFFNMNQVSGPAMPLGTGNIRPQMRPTNFAGGGYTGNGARAGGLDGKGGFMAMMHPRETVVDHTKGQSMGGVTVIQNNTFQSGVTRSEVSALLPKMVEASKAAVLDAKRQGGSYGKAFA